MVSGSVITSSTKFSAAALYSQGLRTDGIKDIHLEGKGDERRPTAGGKTAHHALAKGVVEVPLLVGRIGIPRHAGSALEDSLCRNAIKHLYPLPTSQTYRHPCIGSPFNKATAMTCCRSGDQSISCRTC